MMVLSLYVASVVVFVSRYLLPEAAHQNKLQFNKFMLRSTYKKSIKGLCTHLLVSARLNCCSPENSALQVLPATFFSSALMTTTVTDLHPPWELLINDYRMYSLYRNTTTYLTSTFYFTSSHAASGHKDLNDRTFRTDDGNLCHTKRWLI